MKSEVACGSLVAVSLRRERGSDQDLAPGLDHWFLLLENPADKHDNLLPAFCWGNVGNFPHDCNDPRLYPIKQPLAGLQTDHS